MESFQKMHGLNNEALKKVYKQFLAVDTDKSGMVDINEFCRLLRVERSPFVERLLCSIPTRQGSSTSKSSSWACPTWAPSARKQGEIASGVRPGRAGSIDADELRKIVKATNMASEKQLTRKVEWLMKQCDTDATG